MKRSTAYFREMAWRHAIRKRRIAREVYPYNDFGWDYYQHLHQFSKNKFTAPVLFVVPKHATRASAERIVMDLVPPLTTNLLI